MKLSSGLLSILLLASCNAEPKPKQIGVTNSRFMVLSQTQVKNKLRDKSGIKWRNLYISDSSGTRVLCGEINAKNGYGGKIGFQRFLSGAITVFEEDMTAVEFQKAWNKICAK